jgi:outer membrane protein assembly factor BamB
VVTAGWDGRVRWLPLTGEDPARGPAVQLPDHLDSVPVLGGGRVYVAGWDDRVYALDPEGARVLWRSEVFPGRLRLPPLWHGEVVVVPFGERGLAALGPGGEERWRVELPAPLECPPQGGAGAVLALLEDGRLLRLDLATGEVSRSRRLEGGEVLGLWSGAGRVLVLDGERALHCLDGGDLGDLWERPLGFVPRAEPLFHSDWVLLAGEELVVLDLETGRVRFDYAQWAADGAEEAVLALLWSSPRAVSEAERAAAVRGYPRLAGTVARVYLSPPAGEGEPGLLGLCFADGGVWMFELAAAGWGAEGALRLRWRYSPPVGPRGAPSLVRDEQGRRFVVVGDSGGCLHRLGLGSAAPPAASLQLGGAPGGGILAHGGELYAGTREGNLYRLGLDPLAVQAVAWASGAISTAGAVLDGQVCFGSAGQGGGLYCWDGEGDLGRFPVAGGVREPLLLVGADDRPRLVAVAESGRVLERSATGGWREVTGVRAAAAPAPWPLEPGGVLLLGEDGMLRAHAADWRPVWSLPLPLEPEERVAVLLADGEQGYVLTAEGRFWALDLGRPALLGETAGLPRPSTRALLVLGDLVYGSGDRVVACSVATGALRWEYPAPGVLLDPAADEDLICFATRNGTLLGFDCRGRQGR